MLSQDGELCVLTRTLQTLLLHFLVRGGGERLDTVRSSRPSYSITTRRTCPASGRTGRGRQMRQQLHREPRTGLARTPQTSLSCCWWPVGGGPRKPIMKCYRRRGAAGRVATTPRLLNLSSLYSLGVLKPPLITPWTTNKSSTIF